MYEILIKNKVLKSIEKMPVLEQKKIVSLVEDLRDYGPIQIKWKNFSQLEKNKYHCHLSRKWVACWEVQKNNLIIEVYYAGSRENAPY